MTIGSFDGHEGERDFRKVLLTLKDRRSEQRFEIEVLGSSAICHQQMSTPTKIISRTLEKMENEVTDVLVEGASSRIGVLVDFDHYCDLVSGRATNLEGKLHAVETAFGWTHDIVVESKVMLTNYRTCVSESDKPGMDDIVKKFWDYLGISDRVRGTCR